MLAIFAPAAIYASMAELQPIFPEQESKELSVIDQSNEEGLKESVVKFITEKYQKEQGLNLKLFSFRNLEKTGIRVAMFYDIESKKLAVFYMDKEAKYIFPYSKIYANADQGGSQRELEELHSAIQELSRHAFILDMMNQYQAYVLHFDPPSEKSPTFLYILDPLCRGSQEVIGSLDQYLQKENVSILLFPHQRNPVRPDENIYARAKNMMESFKKAKTNDERLGAVKHFSNPETKIIEGTADDGIEKYINKLIESQKIKSVPMKLALHMERSFEGE
jgi:hypothetical protein